MKRFYINNTLLVNKLKRKGGILEVNEEYESVVFGKKRIYYHIDRDEDVKPLSMLDFLILDVAYSIYMDYDEYREKFSARQLIYALMGEKGSCSEKRVEHFIDEIEKLRKTRITIDYSEEAEGKSSKEYDIKDVPLLPVEKVGTKYKFYDKPPLYKYAEVNGQVISVPKEIFYCKNIVGKTDRNFLIKYALIREIELIRYVTTEKGRFKSWNVTDSIMYFKKASRSSEECSGFLTQLDWCLAENESDKIKYKSDIKDKLSTVVGLHTIRDITAVVGKILDYYVEIGYIEGYEFLRRNEKGSLTGIKIKGKIKDI